MTYRTRGRSSLRITRRGAVAALAGAAAAPAIAILALQDLPSVHIEEFGGGIGTTDNSSALRRAMDALARRGGGILQLEAGTYRFASASLGYGGVEMPSGVTIRGRGKHLTRLHITGSNECYFFLNERSGRNQSIRSLTARGNNVARSSGPGGFYYCSVLRDGAASGVANCVFEDVRLENFRGDFWIRFYCTHPVYTIAGCGLQGDCEARSEQGNARDPNQIGVPSFIVEFRADGGTIENCFVRGLSADLDFVKGGIAVFGAVRGLHIQAPILRNAFQAYRRPDRGAYAILLYDSQGIVSDTLIERPVIINPYSCGIYAAGSTRTQIISPDISGQADPNDTSLPKAAIALNGANHVRIVEANLRNNRVDLDIAGISGAEYNRNMDIVIEGGNGRDAEECGIKIKPSAFARECGGIRLLGYSSITGRQGASGMAWVIPTDRRPAGISGFVWDGGECTGGPGGYDMNLHRDSTRPHPSGDVEIRNVRLAGSNVIASIRAVGFAGGPISLTNLRFEGSAGRHIEVSDSMDLTLDQIIFNGRPGSGAHTSIQRTPVRMRAVRSAVGGRI